MRLYSKYLFCSSLMLLLLQAQPWSAEAPAPKATTSTYKISIIPDRESRTENQFVVRLERSASKGEAKGGGEAILSWTSAAGVKSSFPLRRVSETIWANQIALGPQKGKNKLNFLLLGKSEEGMLNEATELIYEFELPGGKITFLGEVEPHSSELLQAAKLLVPGSKGISVPVVVLIVAFFNLLLLLPGLLLVKVMWRFSPGIKRRGAVLPQGGAALHPLYSKMLAGAGLIDRRTGAALNWGAAQSQGRTESGDGVATAHKEAMEATILEPDAGMAEVKERKIGMEQAKFSVEDLKNMPTENLVELVGAAIDGMGQGKVGDELKELIKAAERELAEREQKTESANEAVRDPGDPDGAPDLSEPVPEVREAITINGAAEIKQQKIKLDMADLSF